MSIIAFPNGYFPYFNKGKPLYNGKIYIGIPDLDPTIPANQLSVTAIQESGDEIEIPQPIRTSSGGVPIYNGSPVTLSVPGEYSLSIQDSLGNQIYYSDRAFPVTNSGDLNNAEERLLGVGSSLYKGSNGSYVQNGDTVPVGTTHLTVLINGKAEDVRLSSSVSGVVADLTEASATIGGFGVALTPWFGSLTNYQAASIDDMISGKTIGGDIVPHRVGQAWSTLGYYSAGDGGGSNYIIVPAGTGVNDGGSYHNLTNGEQAELITNDVVDLAQFGGIYGYTTDSSIKSANQTVIQNVIDFLKYDRNGTVSASGKIKISNTYCIPTFTSSDVLTDVMLVGQSRWKSIIVLDDDNPNYLPFFNYERIGVFSSTAYNQFFNLGQIPTNGTSGVGVGLAGTQMLRSFQVCGFNVNAKCTGQLINASFKDIRSWCSETSVWDWEGPGQSTTVNAQDFYLTNCSGTGHIIADITHSYFNNIIHELCGLGLQVAGNDLGNVYSRFYFEANTKTWALTQNSGHMISWTNINNVNPGTETSNQSVFGYLGRAYRVGQDQVPQAEAYGISYATESDPSTEKGTSKLQIKKSGSTSTPSGLGVSGLPSSNGVSSSAGMILSNEQRIFRSWTFAIDASGAVTVNDPMWSVVKNTTGTYTITCSKGINVAWFGGFCAQLTGGPKLASLC